MAEEVRGRGKIIVAIIVVAVVAGAIAFALGRDDLRDTPVEDVVAGRDVAAGSADPTDSDPGLPPEAARPQGKEAPDSQEGRAGAGSPATTRETPALNPSGNASLEASGTGSPGRNAPPSPGAKPQNAPDGSLRSSPQADVERSREPQ